MSTRRRWLRKIAKQAEKEVAAVISIYAPDAARRLRRDARWWADYAKDVERLAARG